MSNKNHIIKRLREDIDYQEFFKRAMKMFDINSPADLKNSTEKKEFFDYIEKHYKAKGE